MPMYSSEFNVRLELLFKNGNKLISSFRNTDDEYSDFPYQLVSVKGKVDSDRIENSVYFEDFGDSLGIDPDDTTRFFGEFCDDGPISCNYLSIALSQLTSAESVSSLVQILSDLYAVYHIKESDIISNICPDVDDDLQNNMLEEYLDDEDFFMITAILNKFDTIKEEYNRMKENISRIITGNMETMDDLEEATLITAQFRSYNGYCNFWLDVFRSIDYEMSTIKDTAGNNIAKIIEAMKQLEVFKTVDDDSIERTANVLLNSPQNEACNYVVKQTWKRGDEVHIDYEFIDEPGYGTYDICDFYEMTDNDEE